MKRFGFIFVFVLVLSLSFVSAGFFGDLWNQITGNFVESNQVNNEIVDSGKVPVPIIDDPLPDALGASLNFSVKDPKGNSLKEFEVFLYDSENNLIAQKSSEVYFITFFNLDFPLVYKYTVSKEGYENKSGSVFLKYEKQISVEVVLEKELDFEISLATLKDTYNVGEQIKLTDPPEGDFNNLNVRGFGLTGNVVGFENKNFSLAYKENNYLNNYLDEQIFSDEGIFIEKRFNKTSTPKYFGYIIEFEEPPIIEKKVELEKIAKENQESFFSDIPLIRELFTLPEDVPRKLEDYKQELIQKHDETKEIILSKTNKEVKKEFTTVFNGISLDVSDSEAKEIESLEGVKRVYPNYEVKVTLMDSVPQIGADKVWKLNGDLTKCSESLMF
jgi:hypothetical protein